MNTSGTFDGAVVFVAGRGSFESLGTDWSLGDSLCGVEWTSFSG